MGVKEKGSYPHSERQAWLRSAIHAGHSDEHQGPGTGRGSLAHQALARKTPTQFSLREGPSAAVILNPLHAAYLPNTEICIRLHWGQSLGVLDTNSF